MRTRTVRLAVLASSSLLAFPAAPQAAPPGEAHTSCADFGANVAFLAQMLGGDFGATASSVASSGPGAFPAVVVRPEQNALCEPR